MTLLDHDFYPDPVRIAASVAESGWPVIPLVPGTKKPVGAGGEKHRGIWQTTAEGVYSYADDYRAENRDGKWPAWGVILGEPNADGWRLTVLDTDSDDAEDRLKETLASDDTWQVWSDHTTHVQTNRGTHRYGITRAEVPTCKPWEEFDLKASGYTLLPGSLHPSGLRYADSSPAGAVITTLAEQPAASMFRPQWSDDEDTLKYDWALITPIPTGLLNYLAAQTVSRATQGMTTQEAKEWFAQFAASASAESSGSRSTSTEQRVRASGSAYDNFMAAVKDAGRKIITRGFAQALVSCPGPSHSRGDRNPSLSVTGVEGRVLLKCFSGCDTQGIVEPLGLTMADLFDDAYDDSEKFSLDLTVVDLPEGVEVPEDGDDIIIIAAADEGITAEEAKRPQLRRTPAGELKFLPDPDDIIRGVLPGKKKLAMLSGSRGLGKSLIALDLACSIAGRLPFWRDEQYEIRHYGKVVYVAMEGYAGFKKRFNAWVGNYAAEHGGILPDPRLEEDLIFLDGELDLRRRDHQEMLIAAAKADEAMVLVIDSAAATGAGKEDTDDMGKYVAGLEHVRKETGALVFVLHNTGWDGSRERGSTILPDRCDVTLHFDGDPNGTRTLTHRKNRDGEPLEPMNFTFAKVENTESGVLSFDPSAVTVTVNATNAPDPSKKAKTAQSVADDSADVLAVVKDWADADGWWSKDDIIRGTQMGRDRVTKALTSLLEIGWLEHNGPLRGRRYRVTSKAVMS